MNLKMRERASFAVVLLAVVGVSIAGCSSSGKTASASSAVSAVRSALSSAVGQLSSASASTLSTTTPRTSAASTSAATSLDLSGKWSGQYQGSYQGTFTLSWQQTKTALTGSITISSPTQTLSLNGTLTGSVITFGTVGSLAITYTGASAVRTLVPGAPRSRREHRGQRLSVSGEWVQDLTAWQGA
jgi:outer membrane murein-binding lipoprotein Lpp